MTIASINGESIGIIGNTYTLAPGCGDFYCLTLDQSFVDSYQEKIGSTTVDEITYSIHVSYEKDGEKKSGFSDEFSYTIEK